MFDAVNLMVPDGFVSDASCTPAGRPVKLKRAVSLVEVMAICACTIAPSWGSTIVLGCSATVMGIGAVVVEPLEPQPSTHNKMIAATNAQARPRNNLARCMEIPTKIYLLLA